MIAFFRGLFRRAEPEPDPEPPETDVAGFVARQRASRKVAIDQRRASERVTRQLRANPLEGDLLSRLEQGGGRDA